MKAGRKILVTGGCGFIGTHLVRRLTSARHSVRVLDLNPPSSRNGSVEYIQGNVLDTDLLRKSLEGVGQVFHLAAKPSVEFCENRPLESYQVNFLATIQVLETMLGILRSGSQNMRLIFASSAAIYGNEGKGDCGLSEDDVATGPLSHYGLQKLACEKAIALFHQREPRLQSVVLRLFNVFGPGFDPSSPYASVIPAFARQIESRRSIQIHGDGKQTRDFVHIDDIVSAFVRAGECADSAARGQSYNVGTGKACSIRHLAETMVRLSGRSIKIETTKPRTGDISHSVASIALAQKNLNWQPTVDLAVGLSGMAETLGLAPVAKAA